MCPASLPTWCSATLQKLSLSTPTCLHSTWHRATISLLPSLHWLAGADSSPGNPPWISHVRHIVKQTQWIYVSNPICVARHTPYKLTGSNIPKLHSTIAVPHTKNISLFQKCKWKSTENVSRHPPERSKRPRWHTPPPPPFGRAGQYFRQQHSKYKPPLPRQPKNTFHQQLLIQMMRLTATWLRLLQSMRWR